MGVSAIEAISSVLNAQSTSAVSQTEDTDFESVYNATVSKSKSLSEIFEEAADKYDVDVNLLMAVAKAESNFNPDDTSSSGAMGIMQLMPDTAKELGVTDAYDAEQNIMGGAKYLSRMLERYDGDVSLALAAYNAGPGNVDKYGGIPPFTETQNYVKKVLSYMQEGVTAPDTEYTSTYYLSEADNESSVSEGKESTFRYKNSDNVVNIIHVNSSDSSSAVSSATSASETSESTSELESYYTQMINLKMMDSVLSLMNGSDDDDDSDSTLTELLLSNVTGTELTDATTSDISSLSALQGFTYNDTIVKLLLGN
ncbi:MAG: lytic transglycosylase domain-containing protein [Eubacterium sp.]|nr:lytic transglycosylase domain-containing protein [Eubacterium sp.]